MLAAYRSCLSPQHSKYLLISNLLGRLPNGMAPLAIALFLRSQGLGFGTVGAVTALYGLSMAVGGPLLGRAVDRFGQVRVLPVSAGISAVGFLALVGAGDGSVAAASAAAVLAGLFSPPLEPCLRTLWPSVLKDPRDISAAYALDASLQEVVFVAGPLLVVGLTSVADPSVALVVTTVAMLVGTLAYIVPEPVRHWRAEPRTPDWAGPLRSVRLRQLLVSLAFVGAGLGALNIATVAYQEHVGSDGLSGILLGVNAAGALIGGLYYGAREWRADTSQRLTVLLLGMFLCNLPLVLVPHPIVVGVLVFCSGLFLAPALTCGFAIIGEVAPQGTVTEAFAWMVTAVLAGNALGSSTAGTAEQQVGIWASFLVLVVAGAVAFATAALFRRGRSGFGGPTALSGKQAAS
ncbi:MFS transporter [Streptomyces clavuligerus]|uniref:Transmembrane transport protein n=1 Tax=Streptomyces clavuligerus TaxID=1901 RepID=E2Q4A7_STRCL|nr:MFS transporter [Streptomyces clavuligerus]ANW20145.1 transporter [Streptomyces clavuligerus]AXU14772.1 MFS transporter [Streptomyces clavuligerus]EFG06945.1 Transmembrane transport protein [Streptomyces clavuligerus]MBY6304800.1 MFS transporter [Streptomyces clavuligerus]QCS07542.1 MFS transporter [Streptomyces clavuligerus]